MSGVTASAAGGVSINIAVGDSRFATHDTITGYHDTAAGDLLNFATGTVAIVAPLTSVGAFGNGGTYGIAGGLLTFSNAQTLAQVEAIVTGTIDTIGAAANGATYAWSDGTNTWVFNHNTTDSVVELLGVHNATALSTTAAAATIMIG